MMSVSEVAARTGVSQRTLHYYDEIDLLKPTRITDAGYRLYDAQALERLQHILFFKELGFPLKVVRALLDDPTFDRRQALQSHLELLEMKRQHIDNLITMTKGLSLMGTKHLKLSSLEANKLDEYAAQAREAYGHTEAYKEYERRFAGKSASAQDEAAQGLMALLGRFGAHLGEAPASPDVQALVPQLQEYISLHFYTCTDEILASLADMYDGDGRFTRNIDHVGGEGTAHLAAEAIRWYTRGN